MPSFHGLLRRMMPGLTDSLTETLNQMHMAPAAPPAPSGNSM